MKLLTLTMLLAASMPAFADTPETQIEEPILLAGDAANPHTTTKHKIVIRRANGEETVREFSVPAVPALPPLPPLPPLPTEIELQLPDMLPGDMGSAMFMSHEGMGVVKGAPYSADASFETIQQLADGNRIVRKTSSKLFRDSQGRTRQESYTQDGKLMQVVIRDPATGEHLMLRPERKTAVRMKLGGWAGWNQSAAKERRQAKPMVHMEMEQREEGNRREERRVIIMQGKPPMGEQPSMPSADDLQDEQGAKSLGSKEMEGVKAEGKQRVRVIEAGQIGNEKPIQISTERWYAPELKLVLLSRQSDPRSGEKVYRLSNLKRSEPDAALFKLPEGYKVREPQMSWPKPPAPPAPPKAGALQPPVAPVPPLA